MCNKITHLFFIPLLTQGLSILLQTDGVKAGRDVNASLSLSPLLLCGPIPDEKSAVFSSFSFSSVFFSYFSSTLARSNSQKRGGAGTARKLLFVAPFLVRLYSDAHWDLRELLPSALKLLRFSWAFLALWSNGSFLPHSCKWSCKK